jgi:predicted metal-dependent hydrolase
MVSYTHTDTFGQVRVHRRKGMRSIRISITQNGEVRLSLPFNVSLQKGLQFLQQKKDWVLQHKTEPQDLGDGMGIGPHYTLQLQPTSASKSSSIISNNIITIKIPDDYSADQVQKTITRQARKVLATTAQLLLLQRLDVISNSTGLSYTSGSIKFLQSRWGSCSSTNDIVLNTYLVQLPQALIDYVICHELAHTKHHNHSDSFWQLVQRMVPDYKARKKQLKTYPTAIFDTSSVNS